MGTVANGLLGSLFDPANISGAFGNNKGPGAFMDPNGSGGSLLPGQSLGQKGILGINPEGTVGINPSTSNDIGMGINAVGGGIAGGATLGGSGLLSSGGSGTLADGATYQTAGMSANVPASASADGGIMNLMKSPLTSTLLNQTGNFANSSLNKPAAPPPQQPAQRQAQQNPVAPVGPQPGMQANPAAVLAQYAQTIRSLSMAA